MDAIENIQQQQKMHSISYQPHTLRWQVSQWWYCRPWDCLQHSEHKTFHHSFGKYPDIGGGGGGAFMEGGVGCSVTASAEAGFAAGAESTAGVLARGGVGLEVWRGCMGEPDTSAMGEQAGKETVRLWGVSDRPSSWLMVGSLILGWLTVGWLTEAGCFLFAITDWRSLALTTVFTNLHQNWHLVETLAKSREVNAKILLKSRTFV